MAGSKSPLYSIHMNCEMIAAIRKTVRQLVMLQEETVVRVLRMGTLFTLAFCGTLILSGRFGWALGFACGAALSLFSLLSLGVLIPRLLNPQFPARSKALLALTFFGKLPFFATVLYFASRFGSAQPGFLASGALLAPGIITGRTIADLVSHRAGEKKPETASGEALVAPTGADRAIRRHRPPIAEVARERV
ncbi:MAG TPA: hypothetical protein VGS41_08755 [Chthonomonadales bacterium]|nr:hypothetical protein [Chthonomonadales bacterium]